MADGERGDSSTMDQPNPADPVAQPHEPLAQRLVHLPDQMGEAALPVLRAALNHPDPWVRSHAVAALARLEGDGARDALVEVLHDESFGVHWAAAHALASSGRSGVVAVLRATLHDVLSTGFLHGLLHVLSHAPLTAVEREAVAPLLDALHRSTADVEAPVQAEAALARLEERPTSSIEQSEPWYRARRPRRWSRAYTLGV